MIKMSRTISNKLHKFKVGGLPIIRAVIERLRLKEVLYEYMPAHANEAIPAVESLMIIIYNLVLSKAPLYELEQWVCSLDQRCLGYANLPQGKFNDDRFGRALDKLFQTNRSALMTKLVSTAVKEFNLDMSWIHNDSTTVKACGSIPGRTATGLELKRGHSKDYRPDLKQLVYNLSITADGAVPVHHHCYSGNRTDDTTHIETWNILREINGRADFIYVADSKLCTDEQLSHIVSNGGCAVTIVPETWAETKKFKDILRKTKKQKKEIWRRVKPGSEEEIEYFSVFNGQYVTKKRGYTLHWIYSSQKRKRDRFSREQKMRKAEDELMNLNARINQRNLKTGEAIEESARKILASHQVNRYYHLEVGSTHEEVRKQIGKGRPGKHTKFRQKTTAIHTLTWARHRETLKEESRVDGVFPLLCTDAALATEKVLKAYKFQPRLEKRFSQFKWVHNAAPLLFKKIERVEANMFAFFIALMLQALIEREIRTKMQTSKIPSLTLYPEEREACHPTTNKVMRLFEDVSTYTFEYEYGKVKEFMDDLTETQQQILKLMEIPLDNFWRR
jgi:transposase